MIARNGSALDEAYERYEIFARQVCLLQEAAREMKELQDPETDVPV